MASPSTTIEFSEDWDDPGWFRFPRLIARDERLSWKAKGVAVLLASHKAKTFVFSATEIQRWAKDGKAATNAALQELEVAGYLVRQRKWTGEMVYKLFASPVTENQVQADGPLPGNPPAGNPLADNRTVYKKTTPKETTREEEHSPPKDSLTSGEEPTGSMTWSIDGVETAQLPIDASAAEVSAALVAAENVKPTADELMAGFESWWALYPRKIGKQAAGRAYLRVLRRAKTRQEARELWQALMAGVRQYAAERKAEDSRFTAHAQTWLNQGRWEDEPSRQGSSTKPSNAANDSKWEGYNVQADLEKIWAAEGRAEQPPEQGVFGETL
jgi:hypothetical protein